MENEKKPKAEVPTQLKKDIESMADALSRSLRFMTKIINEDNRFMEKYYARYGDIKWRPPIAGNDDERGDSTEIDMIMKADSLGLPIKRLIDTLSVIEQKLGVPLDEKPPKNPSSATYTPVDEFEHSKDSEARAQAFLDAAAKAKTEE